MSDPTNPAAVPGFKYWAFISYSHADKRWGNWLHGALETYRVPRKLVGTEARDGKVPARLFPIFRDREELPTSSDLGGNIREALEQSRYLIVICSPRSARSHWVNEEILSFKRLGRENRILPLIVDGEPNASDGQPGRTPEAECFPPALRFSVGPDGALSTVRAEPIAADARRGRDGRDNAKLKLLAGLLGVNYDALRQRERERQRRRRMTTALVTLVLAGAFLGLWRFEQQTAARRLKAAHEDAERKSKVLAAHQAAEAAEETGRRELLAGHATAAVALLQKALAAEPDRPAARLMLGVAARESDGSVAVLEHEEEKVQWMDLSPTGAHLLVIGLDGRVASLWDVAARRLLRKIPLTGNESMPGSHFNARGDKLLLPGEKGWRIQDVASGQETDLPAVSGSHACFLGDGAQVLWCKNPPSEDTTTPVSFTVFDAATGAKIREFALEVGSAGGLQSDRAGRTALAGWFAPAPAPPGVKFWFGEPRLKWFEVDSGRIIADLPRPDTGPLELSPDGERLLYLRADRCFEARSKDAALWSLPRTRDLLPSGHWSRGGKYAIVSAFGKTTVFDGATGKPMWGDVFTDAATDAADALLAYADQNGTVHVRELATGRTLAEFSDRIGWPDQSQFPRDRLAAFSPDGRFLILAGSGHSVKIWDWRRAVVEPVVLGEPGGAVVSGAVEFGANGQRMAVRQGDGSVAIWDTESGQRRASLATGGNEGGAWTMSFNTDGSQLVTGAEKPPELFAAQIWDVATGQSLARLDDGATAISPDGATKTRSPMLEQHIRAAWAADRIITVNFNLGLSCLWDATTRSRVGEFAVGARTMELAPGGGEVHARLATAADGRRFIVAGFDDSARVFDTHDGRPVATLAHPFPKLDRAELNADGAVALTADAADHVAVWDVAKSQTTATPEAGPARINEAHLSRDGRLVFAACSDKCVRIWNAADGKLLRVCREEKPPGEGVDTLGAPMDLAAAGNAPLATGFLSVQGDAQGFWLAGINDDGHLCVWELASGRQLLRWKLDRPSRGARLSAGADGQSIAVTGVDGAVRLYHLTPGSLPK